MQALGPPHADKALVFVFFPLFRIKQCNEENRIGEALSRRSR